MLSELLPRAHARYAALPILGPHLDAFVAWLFRQGYPRIPVERRVYAARGFDELLQRDGVRQPQDLTATELLSYVPVAPHSHPLLYRAALIRSLVQYFEEQGALAPQPATPAETLLASYQGYLESVRGLSISTCAHHIATARELLDLIHHHDETDRIRRVDQRDIERFLQMVGGRLSRGSLQHVIGYLRSFLHFLVAHGWLPGNLAIQIDTPRVYRGERLPQSLPWKTVRALLSSVDRSTPKGRRDYAMLLLVATYGLRAGEVASLTLDDIDWRAGHLRVSRSKTDVLLTLPLTEEVGAALLDYLRHGRPALSHREIFLRVLAPPGPLGRSAMAGVFQAWVRHSGLPIPFQGAHCLRHSLAVHLLRQGTPLKTIGDLLGHRSAESTCVYLRLHVEDLREVALDLPVAAGGVEAGQ